MNAEIDNFPVSQLQSRYSIGKQAVYNRLDALGIKPFKEGNRSYITAMQLRLLDELHQHIAAGGTMADFSADKASPADTVDIVSSQLDTVETSITPSAAANFGELVKAIATAIQPPADPLHYMDVLERAAEKDWLLTTAEVKQLISVKPKTSKGEKVYKRGCWLFQKAGKIGSKTAWKVSKSVNEADN